MSSLYNIQVREDSTSTSTSTTSTKRPRIKRDAPSSANDGNNCKRTATVEKHSPPAELLLSIPITRKYGCRCSSQGNHRGRNYRHSEQSFIATFPAGKYYVGDPCYILSNKTWQETIVQNNYFQLSSATTSSTTSPVQVQNVNGTPVFIASTYGGDRTFEGNGMGDRTYFVDSASIGILPWSLMEKNPHKSEPHIFDNDFSVSVCTGLFIFDSILPSSSSPKDGKDGKKKEKNSWKSTKTREILVIDTKYDDGDADDSDDDDDDEEEC
jgi:hypothetical protein